MGSLPLDLEALRKIFEDKRSHVVIGEVKKTEATSDRSVLRCLLGVIPDGREIVARYTWPATGPNAGICFFPVVGDLVVVVFADGSNDDAYIISRISSKVDNLPVNALNGDLVMKALADKKAWLTGQIVQITQGDSVGTENLVLGQQLKNLLVDVLGTLKDLCDLLASHTHVGNLGFPTAPPAQASQFSSIGSSFAGLKASPVEDEAILSSFSFTEKGS